MEQTDALIEVARLRGLTATEADRRLSLCPDCLQFDDHDTWCENPCGNAGVIPLDEVSEYE